MTAVLQLAFRRARFALVPVTKVEGIEEDGLQWATIRIAGMSQN